MAEDTYALNEPTSQNSGHNSLRFAMEMAKNAMMTVTIVKVKKVTVADEVGPIGRVNVTPLVQMVDGIQRTTDHVTVNNLPYMRMAGGVRAVIMDPKEGDIGFVVTADRDISGVKEKEGTAPPGSGRRYNISDGMFVGSVIAKKPTSYVRFKGDNEIEISPDKGVTSIWIRGGRIDLGMKDAPHAVVTVDGPSTKVFAVISESGSED